MAEASTVPTVDTYNKYYQAVLAGLQGENGMPERTDSQLKNYLTRIMRPTYDQAIRQRQLQTGQNRAAIDADAASRGMGTSSWVSDAKMRQGTQEARDIADIENSYNSALYEALLAQMQQRDANRLQLMNMASGLAGNLYAQDQQPSGGGGSYGGSSGRRRSSGSRYNGNETGNTAGLTDPGYGTGGTKYAWVTPNGSYTQNVVNQVVDQLKSKTKTGQETRSAFNGTNDTGRERRDAITSQESYKTPYTYVKPNKKNSGPLYGK